MPSTIPRASMNDEQWVSTFGTSLPELRRCSPRSQPKTRSRKIPRFFSFPRAGRDKMKLLKNVMSLPCLRRTGLVGSLGESDWSEFRLVKCGSVALLCGRFNPCGTLSPMTSTHSQGKNPTSKPRLPLHHIDSSGPGMSITEIMSPTSKLISSWACLE